MPDWNALRYSQTKKVTKTTRRFSDNFEKIMAGNSEECDLSPVEERKGVLTHTGKQRWGNMTSPRGPRAEHKKKMF